MKIVWKRYHWVSPYSRKNKMRRLTKSPPFMHVVWVRYYILPNQLRSFHENSAKMIPLKATILSEKKMRRLTKSPLFLHVLCFTFYILPNQLRDFMKILWKWYQWGPSYFQCPANGSTDMPSLIWNYWARYVSESNTLLFLQRHVRITQLTGIDKYCK